MTESRWESVKLKSLSSLPIRNGVGEKAQDWSPRQLRYVRTTDIGSRLTLRESSRRSVARSAGSKAVLRKGDLLFTAAGATIGKSYLHILDDEEACYAGYLVRFRPTTDILGRFVSYWSQSAHFWDQVNAGAVVSTIPNFSAGRYRSLEVPLPDRPTIELIVRYLDNAEVRIARALQSKTHLVALLRERRAVLVEEHVLRGVADPLRGVLIESEVPWLGQVPASWELVPFRSVFARSRHIVGARSNDFTLLSLTKQGVIVRDLSQMKGKFPASFNAYQRVEPGDLVMCLFDVDETPRTVGLAQDRGMITGAYSVFTPVDSLAARFAERQLLAIDEGKKFRPLYKGLRKVIPHTSLASARLCLPPRDRMEQVILAVDQATQTTDEALRQLDREIESLREYRIRLITDVVTGKRDVRARAMDMKEVDPRELAATLAGIASEVDDLPEEEGLDGD